MGRTVYLPIHFFPQRSLSRNESGRVVLAVPRQSNKISEAGKRGKFIALETSKRIYFIFSFSFQSCMECMNGFSYILIALTRFGLV